MGESMREHLVSVATGNRRTLTEDIEAKRAGLKGLSLPEEGIKTDNTRSGTREAFKKLKHEADMTGAIEIGKPDPGSDDVESWIERPAA